MKSFKEFISEEDKKPDTEDKWHLVDALNLVKKDCLQFLHKTAADGKFYPMYRGLKNSVWPKYEMSVRRLPRSETLDKDIRDSLRRVFETQFGKAFGSDAMICSGGQVSTEKHLIFPIGKFDYLWAEKIKDLDSSLGDSEEEGELYFDLHTAQDDKERDKLIKEFIKSNDFQHNKEIKTCLKKGHEVMIECKYFYAVPTKIVKQYYDVFSKMLGELHNKKDL